MTTKPEPDGLKVVGDVVVIADEPVPAPVKRAPWWRRMLARLFG